MIPLASVVGTILALFASQKLFGKKSLLDLHWFVVIVASLIGSVIFQVAARILSVRFGYGAGGDWMSINPLFILALFFVAKWLNRREASMRQKEDGGLE